MIVVTQKNKIKGNVFANLSLKDFHIVGLCEQQRVLLFLKNTSL